MSNTYNNTFHTKVGNYARDVSIIGVGNSPWMLTHKHPEWNGITEQELFALSAISAMDDAGITGKDIDALAYSQLFTETSQVINPNVFVEDWLGMRGKASWHTESACTSPAIAFDTAVMAVASGKYDVVLAGGVDIAQSRPKPNMPACFREPQTADELHKIAATQWTDTAYTRYSTDEGVGMMEDYIPYYMNKYGVTSDQIDDALNGLAISDSRSAALCPDAIMDESYVQLAKKAGYDDVHEYMKSPHNPKIANYVRVSGTTKYADGSAAVIVCASNIAQKISKNTPIKVLGTGNSFLDHIHPFNLNSMTKEATSQLYERTGLSGKDIDLLLSPNFMITEALPVVEQVGYIPEGQAWEYFKDGRTAFDGDKPFNPGGGTQCFGHCYGAGGLLMISMAVKQMRGEAGAIQVKKTPQTSLIRAQGGAQGTIMIALGSPDKY
ncbi:thiolase family protein [Secundilactobacillus folii]|uniref:Thiolase family protein n=1 Tax=Secundilactobacillus folii TaxID=2678357 RepID=A0A7X2XW80_9LACO|nr:thiolase family protein [Secundilactobacillus folii]MTV82758.1 thiolase family protein [Secundilactobacillus folii]